MCRFPALKSEKKDKKEKVPPMEAHHGMTERSHPFGKTVTVHHKHGGHTTTHHHDTDESQNKEYSSEHLDGVIDGLQTHVGEPNEGEPQADAGQHSVPPEIAGPAGLPTQGQ